MKKSYKRPESVLVVVHQDEQVLLLLRGDAPNFWQSVTGSMGEGEAPLEAAWRELQEETGLTTVDGKMHDCARQEWFDIYPTWRHRYAPGITRNLEHVFSFKMTSSKPVVLSHEHLQFEWVPKDLAAKKVTSETNRNAILQFVKSRGEENGRS